LQPAQDEDEQPPHPEPPVDCGGGPLADLPMPNCESRFRVSFAPQSGHVTSGLDP
jgi:hypothetical protein